MPGHLPTYFSLSRRSLKVGRQGLCWEDADLPEAFRRYALWVGFRTVSTINPSSRATSADNLGRNRSTSAEIWAASEGCGSTKLRLYCASQMRTRSSANADRFSSLVATASK